MGADTFPADSVDTDSSLSTVSPFGLTLTDMLRGDVAADGAVSLGSICHYQLLRHVHENACTDTPYLLMQVDTKFKF